MSSKKQKSLLSFFSAVPKKELSKEKDESISEPKKEVESPKKSLKNEVEDSPIKQRRRRAPRVIESDSEDDEKCFKSSSPAKSEEEKENKEEKKIENKSTPRRKTKTEKDSESTPSKAAFTEESVPPLRVTARKQMKRKSDCLEDEQKEVVKKIKCEEDEPMEVDEQPKSPKKKKSPKTKAKNNFKTSNVSYNKFFSKFRASEKKEESDQDESDQKLEEPNSLEENESKDESIKKKEIVDKMEVSDENENNESVEDLVKEEDVDSTDKTEEDEKKSSKKIDGKTKKATESSKKAKSRKSSPKSKNNSKNSKSSAKEPTSDKVSGDEKSNDDLPIASPDRENDSKKKSEEENISDSKSEKESGENISDSGRPKKAVINPFAPKPKSDQKSVGKSFNPAKSKYHPITDAFWARGDKVPYLALARTFELIEETRGRLRTIEILANLFRSIIVLSPEDFINAIYLCLNSVAPAFEGLELNLGETILFRAIAQTTGRSVDCIKSDLQELGDLGKVAENSKSSQRTMFTPAPLTLTNVFKKLREIALMSGNAVMNKKIDKIKAMFVACRESEARYLIRSLGGKLRIGLAEQSVLQAIAQACYLTPPEQEYPPTTLNAGKDFSPEVLKSKFEEFALIVKTTYCECPSYDQIVPILLKHGVKALPEHCKLTPGVPLKPMLAHPTKGISEVFKRFEDNKFTCEYKYDGERAQIHLLEDGNINVYSRNQENNTTKYPDIIARIKGSYDESKVQSFIMDSEAVAWDKEKESILPFQILSTRKRKDVKEEDIKVQVCVFPFDLLYLNGESLVQKPFEERRRLLKETFKEVPGELIFAKSMDSASIDDIQEFLDESIKGNCEGLMVKTLDVDATYEIAKRSHNWLKVKKDYLEGVGDSIDVVVIGGFMGKGKRAGSYGGFLLACYDPENEEFQSICKIGTGFTDENLAKHTEFLKEHCIDGPKSYYRFDQSVAPDVWFDAVQVWEIKCADLSISPVHKAAAGIVDPEKGISLRFPRFLRIRDDKNPESATSAQQIADMYSNQDQIKNSTQDKGDAEDFY